MNLTQDLNKFISDLESKGRASSTITAYKKDIQQLIDFLEDNTIKKYQEITSIVLSAYIESLKNSGTYTLKTVSRKINSLKTFSKFLLETKKINNDPAEKVEHPKLKKQQPRVLSPLEYRALRDTIKNNDRLYCMVELLLQTGIRIGELSRLETNDVHLDSNNAYINIKQFSSNPERSVELNETAKEVLKNFLNKKQKYVFTTKSGNPVLIRNIRTTINRAFKKTGIQNATVNDLRNTFITQQLNNGINLETLAKIVGHKNSNTTERYLELTTDRPSRTTDKITIL